MNDLKIGCHLSSSDGFLSMGKTALSIGANTFAFFTRNPRGGKAKAIEKSDTDALIQLMNENDFGRLVAHAPYTLNACAAEPRTRDFALMCLGEDFERMEYVPNNYYNFHPGSHVGQGVEKGIELIADALNQTMRSDMTTTVLLETMAGKGSEVGSRFEELYEIISRVKYNDKLGVCLDTCHVYDGGYDIVSDLDSVLNEFDKIIGLDRLKAVHLNDDMNQFGSHKDRHQKIGEGSIGLEHISKVTNHPSLRTLPFILETPNELDGYKTEITLLRSLYKN